MEPQSKTVATHTIITHTENNKQNNNKQTLPGKEHLKFWEWWKVKVVFDREYPREQFGTIYEQKYPDIACRLARAQQSYWRGIQSNKKRLRMYCW